MISKGFRKICSSSIVICCRTRPRLVFLSLFVAARCGFSFPGFPLGKIGSRELLADFCVYMCGRCKSRFSIRKEKFMLLVSLNNGELLKNRFFLFQIFECLFPKVTFFELVPGITQNLFDGFHSKFFFRFSKHIAIVVCSISS